MSAIIQGSSLKAIARRLGVSESAMLAKRVDLHRGKDRLLADLAASAKRVGGSKNEAQRRDAATAFVTNPLAQILAPVSRPGNENFLFVPGRTGEAGQLLPVSQKVPLGKTTVEWQVLAMTGEAQFIGAGGTRDLKRTGTVDDLVSQPVAFYGVRFGWDRFQLWQGDHLEFRNIEMEEQTSAMQAMDDLMEDTGSFGSNARKIPGFFNHGAAYSTNLAKSFGDSSITQAEMLTQLSIIQAAWTRANPRRKISGVCMPQTHRLNMINVFGGAGDSAGTGGSTWKHAMEMYPWLANIIEDDRLLEASDDSKSMWQLWSADPDELYFEAAPGHMLFGPFDDELNTDFILLNQTGGIVNKRPERIYRFQFPT